MRLHSAGIILSAIFLNCFISAKAQEYYGMEHLKFVKSISLGKVTGKLGNMGFNLKDTVVYVPALQNNSVEVIDLQKGKLLYSIPDVKKPKSICYIPQTDEIFVATGTNNCYFYNCKSFQRVAVYHLMSHSDPVLYDSAEEKIYVGYGEEGIAVISPVTHKKRGFLPLYTRPEGLKLDKAYNSLFTNLPDASTTLAIDLKEWRMGRKWQSDNLLANPLDVDTIQHRVFIGYRKPSMLVIVDRKTGRKIKLSSTIETIEDIYYDHFSQSVYVSGNGAINVFQEDVKGFKQVANIKTHKGASKSLLIPQLKLFVIMKEARLDQNAELLVYKVAE
jgi:DNA-binding beta-propeller fold protein YncE